MLFEKMRRRGGERNALRRGEIEICIFAPHCGESGTVRIVSGRFAVEFSGEELAAINLRVEQMREAY